MYSLAPREIVVERHRTRVEIEEHEAAIARHARRLLQPEFARLKLGGYAFWPGTP